MQCLSIQLFKWLLRVAWIGPATQRCGSRLRKPYRLYRSSATMDYPTTTRTKALPPLALSRPSRLISPASRRATHVVCNLFLTTTCCRHARHRLGNAVEWMTTRMYATVTVTTINLPCWNPRPLRPVRGCCRRTTVRRVRTIRTWKAKSRRTEETS